LPGKQLSGANDLIEIAETLTWHLPSGWLGMMMSVRHHPSLTGSKLWIVVELCDDAAGARVALNAVQPPVCC